MKRLFRSRKEKVLAGVCGGLGLFFNLDPVIVRVIFVLGIFFAGVAPLVYLLMWVIVPLESE